MLLDTVLPLPLLTSVTRIAHFNFVSLAEQRNEDNYERGAGHDEQRALLGFGLLEILSGNDLDAAHARGVRALDHNVGVLELLLGLDSRGLRVEVAHAGASGLVNTEELGHDGYVKRESHSRGQALDAGADLAVLGVEVHNVKAASIVAVADLDFIGSAAVAGRSGK